MTKNKENKETTITFRTSMDLKNTIQAIADKEKRSLSNMIEILLENAVKKGEKIRQ